MSELGPRIRAPKRLWIVTILHGADPVEFAFRQGRLGLSASDHWKQISVLSEAGYVKVNKSGRGPGSTTWFSLTRPGRRAYKPHAAALRQLLSVPVEGEVAS